MTKDPSEGYGARRFLLPALVVAVGFFGAKVLHSAVSSTSPAVRLSKPHTDGLFPDSRQADEASDVTKWKKAKNDFGWTMRIPPGWKDSFDGMLETWDLVYIQGPQNCLAQLSSCGLVSVRRFDPEADISEQSLEAYLGIDQPEVNSKIEFVNLRRSTLAGETALDVCQKDKSTGRMLSRNIVFKHKRALFEISYSEIGKDEKARSDVKAPQDWRYMATFDKMVGTFSLYD